MSEELRECPFCQSRAEHYSFNYRKHTVRCSYCLADCGEHDHPERAAFVWNTRPAEEILKAEVERLKAENDELRYIVKQFEQWRGDEYTRCPRYQHSDYPCLGEKEFKKKFGEDADFDSIECVECEEGYWVEYYRWKFRQKNNIPDTGKGGEDEP